MFFNSLPQVFSVYSAGHVVCIQCMLGFFRRAIRSAGKKYPLISNVVRVNVLSFGEVPLMDIKDYYFYVELSDI